MVARLAGVKVVIHQKIRAKFNLVGAFIIIKGNNRKPKHWFAGIFLVYVLSYHSIILRKYTLGWRGCKIACKGGLLINPTQGGYLTYLGSPIIIQSLKKKLSKISILLLYRIRHKVKIFYFVIFYFPDYFCHYKPVSKYEL